MKVTERPNQTAAGIFLTTVDTSSAVLEGKVLEVAKGSNVPNGTTVWFTKFNATLVEINGVQYYVVSEKVVLGYST